MRWMVEVSSVGKADKNAYCVESESWQRALQVARGIRDDHGPMTGFSIELLDDGFSAVDPMTRLRYFVKRAPDDAPLTPLPSGAAKTPSVVPPAAGGAASNRPTGGAPAAATSAQAKPASSPTNPASSAAVNNNKQKARSKTFVFGSTGAALLAEAQAREAEAKPAAIPASSPPRPEANAASPAIPRPAAVPSAPPAAPAAAAPAAAPATAGGSEPPTNRLPLEQAAGGGAKSAGAVKAAPPAAPPPGPPPTLPGIEVLYRREQDPDTSSPLTYREYVYFFPAASDETMARAMLVAQFELVRSSLDGVRPGKLVNLAIFDVSFQGRPPVPPVVTLTWKDWKGEPAIDFPRRRMNGPSNGPRSGAPVPSQPPLSSPAAGLAPVSHSAPPGVILPVPVAATHGTQPSQVAYVPQPQPAAAAPIVAVAPVPVVAVAPVPIVAVAPAPQAAAPQAPPQPVAVQAAPMAPPPAQPAMAPLPSVMVDGVGGMAAPQTADIGGFPPPRIAAPVHAPQAAPAPVAAPQQPAMAPQPIPQPAPAPPTDAAAAAPFELISIAPPVPPPAPQRSKAARVKGDELIADLFEAMHDLHFLRDSVEGADFCLTLALEKIPSRVGIVHLYDIDHREFVVACVRGANTGSALLRRYPEGDPILAAAMRRQRAIVWPDGGEANALERYQTIGGTRSLVVAPVMLAGRFLGALELLDPLDGAPFTDEEGHALSYIGEQFAEFVATRGVTVDPERITGAARA